MIHQIFWHFVCHLIINCFEGTPPVGAVILWLSRLAFNVDQIVQQLNWERRENECARYLEESDNNKLISDIWQVQGPANRFSLSKDGWSFELLLSPGLWFGCERRWESLLSCDQSKEVVGSGVNLSRLSELITVRHNAFKSSPATTSNFLQQLFSLNHYKRQV